MVDIGVPGFLKDPTGEKTSMMRTGALITVAGAVAIMVGGAFGFADVEVTAENCLWMIAIALTGKIIQRGQEAKQPGGKKAKPGKEME